MEERGSRWDFFVLTICAKVTHVIRKFTLCVEAFASSGLPQLPDGCAFSTEDDTCFNQPAKDVRTRSPDTSSDGFVSLLSDFQSLLFIE